VRSLIIIIIVFYTLDNISYKDWCVNVGEIGSDCPKKWMGTFFRFQKSVK